MHKIFKYEIRPNSVKDDVHKITVDAPRGAKPLHVGVQYDKVYLWMEVNPANPPQTQTPLICLGTGFGSIPPGYEHFQSLQHGPMVWHFYHAQQLYPVFG